MTLDELRQLGDLARNTPAMTCGGRFPPATYYSFLYLLAKHKRPYQFGVELGVCGGGASYHMAKGFELATVIGYDHVIEYPDNMAYIAQHCENWTLYVEDSCNVAAIEHLGKKIDILFIDTVHTKERTMQEWNAWKPLLADGAVVCLDDLNREGMLDAWALMPEPKMLYPELHISGGPQDGNFGFLIYNGV